MTQQRRKLIYFIAAAVPTQQESDDIMMLSHRFDVAVRSREASHLFGEHAEETSVVYNPPAGFYVGVSLAARGGAARLNGGAVREVLAVGDTTRFHAFHSVQRSLAVRDNQDVVSYPDELMDYTGDHITIVTSNATLSSSDTAVATITAAGVITAVAPGETTITAKFSGLTTTTKVTVQ